MQICSKVLNTYRKNLLVKLNSSNLLLREASTYSNKNCQKILTSFRYRSMPNDKANSGKYKELKKCQFRRILRDKYCPANETIIEKIRQLFLQLRLDYNSPSYCQRVDNKFKSSLLKHHDSSKPTIVYVKRLGQVRFIQQIFSPASRRL